MDFTQEYEIDYEETSSLSNICLDITNSRTIQQWKLYQIDVKNIFFEGRHLWEGLYVAP